MKKQEIMNEINEATASDEMSKQEAVDFMKDIIDDLQNSSALITYSFYVIHRPNNSKKHHKI